MSTVLSVCQLEFVPGGNTIWIHAPNGSTTLRIKCTGKVNMETCTTSPVAHGDIMVEGDITICVPKTPAVKKGKAHA